MNPWETWETRVEHKGVTRRDRALNREKFKIENKAPHSLSSHSVFINGSKQLVTILNREELNEKRIISMPGETLTHGGLVDFADNKWLITQIDANDEVYQSGLMEQCNYLLKWRDETGAIIEKWCIVEDGTKYLVGEDTKQFVTTGGSRFAVTIGKDDDTKKIRRGKRFLIYDPDCEDVLAFEVTKPNTLFNMFEGEGVYRYVLVESNLTKNDNKELMIADYYNWDPTELPEEVAENAASTDVKPIGVWL